MRTEEWHQDQGGMLGTGLIYIFDGQNEPSPIGEYAAIRPEILAELMEAAGWVRAPS